jgi:hypothetical protein
MTYLKLKSVTRFKAESLEQRGWDEKDSVTLSALDVELNSGGLDSEAFRGFLACFPPISRKVLIPT